MAITCITNYRQNLWVEKTLHTILYVLDVNNEPNAMFPVFCNFFLCLLSSLTTVLRFYSFILLWISSTIETVHAVASCDNSLHILNWFLTNHFCVILLLPCLLFWLGKPTLVDYINCPLAFRLVLDLQHLKAIMVYFLLVMAI